MSTGGRGSRKMRNRQILVCVRLYRAYRVPIRANGAVKQLHETVKPRSDAAPAALLDAVAIVPLSVERGPPTTHDLSPDSLPVLNPAHCFSSVMRGGRLFASRSRGHRVERGAL